jgi:predicted nuclease of predicted toxin-antitoxin system
VKLLFDQNLSFRLCRELDDLFPGSSQVRNLGLETVNDRTLWNYARNNGYVLVSLDADFADMAALLGPPPKVIWLRCGNQPTNGVAQLIRRYADNIKAFARDEDAACLELY